MAASPTWLLSPASEALTYHTVSPPFFSNASPSRQGGAIRIVDAYPLGRTPTSDAPPSRRRLFFRVECPADADLIVRHRHVLKGSQLTIFDDLSSAERTSHQALWSSFTVARSSGLKAQFKRARLFVTSTSSTYQVVL